VSVSPVVVVVEDSADLLPWVLSRRAQHPSVAGVDVGIEERQSLSGFAETVLVGMGKDPWLSVSKRSAELLAGAWLSLGETSDVVVGYAQQVSERLMPTLLTWLCGFGVRPWLIYTHHGNEAAITERAAKVAADWGVDVAGADDIDAAFPDVAAVAPAAAAPAGLPRLPRVDGMVFRSMCRDLLDPGDFVVVDAEFTAAVAGYRDALRDFVPKYVTRQYAQVVRDRLAAADSTERLLLLTRAAQVAGVTSGVHVTVDTTVLVGAAEALPRPGLANPEGWFDRLDVYRDPDPGTVAALYVAGCDSEDMPTITLGSVTTNSDGSVTIADAVHRYEVRAGARYVSAMAAMRALAGAEPGDTLLATHRAERVRPQFVSKQLYGTAIDTGVQVGSNVRSRRHPDATQWLARYGVTFAKDRNVHGAAA
jgi:hypothetical protein